VHLVWEKSYKNGKLPTTLWKWRDILKLLGKFRSLASVDISLGDTCLLWHDFWNGSIHSQVLPRLFSFANHPSFQSITPGQSQM
jgi:hypothetical protein